MERDAVFGFELMRPPYGSASAPEPDGSHVGRLARELPASVEGELARARAAVAERPIAYPLGSGQAEEVALAGGLRPLIRQLLPVRSLDEARARFERVGLVTAVAPKVYGPTRDGWDPARVELDVSTPGARQALFVGRDRGRVEAAIACDVAKTDEGDRELGRLLGYPRCCVEAFVATSQHRLNTELYEAAAARTKGAFDARLNMLDLGVFHFVSWSPCAFDCALSRAYADAVASRVARVHPAFVVRVDGALGAHRLVLADEVQVSLRGHVEGAGLRLREVWPTARDRHPRAALEPDAAEAVARVVALLRGAQTLEVGVEGLVLDGDVVRATQGARMFPFAARD